MNRDTKNISSAKNVTLNDYTIVTGTLIVQLDPHKRAINAGVNEDNTAEGSADWFSAVLDKADGLVRTGAITCRTHETVVELETTVQRRPSLAEPTLHPLLMGLTRGLPYVIAGEVFHQQHRVATKDELLAELAALTTKAADMAVPLQKRRSLSDAADALKQLIGGVDA